MHKSPDTIASVNACRHTARVGLILGVCLGLGSGMAAGAPLRYRLTLLEPVPGASESYATGINDQGDVVGYSTYSRNPNVAWSLPTIWRNGVPTPLWDPSPVPGWMLTACNFPQPGEPFICHDYRGGKGLALNSGGIVVGAMQINPDNGIELPNPGGLPSGAAFVQSAGGERTELYLPGWGDSEARAINSTGMVAGTYERPGVANGTDVFVWDALGGIRTLGLSGSYFSDIDDDGQILGWYTHEGGSSDGFVWNPETHSLKFIDPGPNVLFRAHAFNAQGTVLGTWFDHSAIFPDQPVLWEPQRGFEHLPTPPGYGVLGLALNDAGTIVATLTGNSAVGTAAFVWVPNRGFVTLASLLDSSPVDALEAAQAVNNQGQIAGFASFSGTYRGYLLTPVPEPTSGWLGTIALLTWLAARRVALRRQARCDANQVIRS